MSGIEFLCRTESLFYYTTTDDVFKFCSNESCSLSRFYMLEFQNLINVTFDQYCKTISKIAC